MSILRSLSMVSSKTIYALSISSSEKLFSKCNCFIKSKRGFSFNPCDPLGSNKSPSSLQIKTSLSVIPSTLKILNESFFSAPCGSFCICSWIFCMLLPGLVVIALFLLFAYLTAERIRKMPPCLISRRINAFHSILLCKSIEHKYLIFNPSSSTL